MKKTVKIGSIIEKHMRKHNLTMKELGEKVGRGESTVSMWISGKSTPRMGIAQQLADIFGITTDTLIYGESENDCPSIGIRIPVLGHVAAGIPIEAIEDIIDYEEIPESMARQGEFFALQIKGDSMEPKISEGDVVIVRKQSSVDSGQTAIVLINGYDATCKKIMITDSGMMLVSSNPSFNPTFYAAEQVVNLPVIIIGRVVELRAKFK